MTAFPKSKMTKMTMTTLTTYLIENSVPKIQNRPQILHIFGPHRTFLNFFKKFVLLK